MNLSARISKLGWIVAAGIGGLMLGGAFQGVSEKDGVVDATKVFANSKVQAKITQKLQALVQARRDLLEFVKLNPTFTTDQLTRYRELSVKVAPSASETAELQKIKSTAQAASKQYDDLRQKGNPTAAEVTTLNDLGNRSTITKSALSQWAGEFQNEVALEEQKLDANAAIGIREAITEVGAKGKYNLVFSQTAAVYGANDISDEVQKALDKKN